MLLNIGPIYKQTVSKKKFYFAQNDQQYRKTEEEASMQKDTTNFWSRPFVAANPQPRYIAQAGSTMFVFSVASSVEILKR